MDCKKFNLTMFGKRFTLARKMSGLNQSELANQLKISQSEVSQYESCKRVPTKPLIARMAKTFDVNPAWLEYGESGAFDYLVMGQVHEITLWHIEPKVRSPEFDKQILIEKIQKETGNLSPKELSIITEIIDVLKICRSDSTYLKYQKKQITKIDEEIAEITKCVNKSLGESIEEIKQSYPEGYKEIEAIIKRYKLKEKKNERTNEEY